MQNIGTRKAVMNGGATKTSGGLKKKDLMINTRGKIVSKKLHNLAVRRIQHGGELLYELKPIEAVKKYLDVVGAPRNRVRDKAETIMLRYNTDTNKEYKISKLNRVEQTNKINFENSGSFINLFEKTYKWKLTKGVQLGKGSNELYIELTNKELPITLIISEIQLSIFFEMK
jgi:hypothetical protein